MVQSSSQEVLPRLHFIDVESLSDTNAILRRSTTIQIGLIGSLSRSPIPKEKNCPENCSQICPQIVPEIFSPSIVKKEHIFSTEIPFSNLKYKSGDKSRDSFGGWYLSENKNFISGQFLGQFWGQIFFFGIGLQFFCKVALVSDRLSASSLGETS